MDIKMRLLQLGKRQTDLLVELHRRGHKEIDASILSGSINYKINAPRGYRCRELCDEILTEWEKEREEE